MCDYADKSTLRKNISWFTLSCEYLSKVWYASRSYLDTFFMSMLNPLESKTKELIVWPKVKIICLCSMIIDLYFNLIRFNYRLPVWLLEAENMTLFVRSKA